MTSNIAVKALDNCLFPQGIKKMVLSNLDGNNT